MTNSYNPPGQSSANQQGQSSGNPQGQSPAGLVDQAKTLGKDLKDKAADLTQNVTQAARDQAGELGTAAKEMAADATGKIQSAMDEQRAAGADYLGNIAQAVQRAAGQFETDVPQAAQYIRQAAGQIETVAQAVRQRDMRELVGEVQEFARRQPTLFFGGAVILGFAALRFLKSSAPQSGTARAASPDYSAQPGQRSYSQTSY